MRNTFVVFGYRDERLNRCNYEEVNGILYGVDAYNDWMIKNLVYLSRYILITYYEYYD